MFNELLDPDATGRAVRERQRSPRVPRHDIGLCAMEIEVDEAWQHMWSAGDVRAQLRPCANPPETTAPARQHPVLCPNDEAVYLIAQDVEQEARDRQARNRPAPDTLLERHVTAVL